MTVPPWALQSGASATGTILLGAALVVGLALVAGAMSALVAMGYRWYVRERAPSGLPILVGLTGVALYLNTSRALSQVISGGSQPFDETTALFNVAAVLVSAATARAAVDVGDRIGSDVFVATGGREVQAEVGRMVQAVGRVITVEIPDEIDDIVGYDPVPDETKAKLAGRTFVFPRRLTVEELRNRLVARLKADYAVGHVDVDLTDEGGIEYMALGSRAAGIGPTLPPETSAVAIRADPAFSAGAGDLVQVWRTDPPERVLTAEVRGVTDDIVTLAVDAADTRRLDDGTRYKLVTLPVEKRADREFASLFRAANETMAAVEIAAGSTLAGQPLGAMDVTVVAVRPIEGAIEPLPSLDRRLDSGETIYVVATPDAIRRVEAAAARNTADPDVSGGATLPPEHRIGPATPIADDPSDGPVTESTTIADETGDRAVTDERSSDDANRDDEATTGEGESTGAAPTADADGVQPATGRSSREDGSTDGREGTDGDDPDSPEVDDDLLWADDMLDDADDVLNDTDDGDVPADTETESTPDDTDDGDRADDDTDEDSDTDRNDGDAVDGDAVDGDGTDDDGTDGHETDSGRADSGDTDGDGGAGDRDDGGPSDRGREGDSS